MMRVIIFFVSLVFLLPVASQAGEALWERRNDYQLTFPSTIGGLL